MITYSVANYGKNIVWNGSDLFLLYYLTDLAGLPPATAGLLLLMTYSWSAVADPIVGWAADRMACFNGKFRPFLLLGAPICAVGFTLTFALPQLPDGPARIGYFLAAILLFRTGYAICDSPHNALMGYLVRSSRRRSSVAATRYFFSAAGSLSLAGLSYLILVSDLTAATRGFRLFGFVGGLTYVGTMLLAWRTTVRFDARQIAHATPIPGGAFAARLSRNSQIWTLFGLAALSAFGPPLFVKGLVFMGKYDPSLEIAVPTGLVLIMIGQMLAMPLWVRIARETSKKQALIAAHLVVIAAVACFPLANDLGVGSSVVAMLLAGLGLGGVNMLMWSMLPDVIDLISWRERIHADGRMVGSFTLCLKLAAGLGTALFGFCLDWAGYVPNSPQAPNALAMLSFCTIALPIAASIACVLLCGRYRIDERSHQAITRAIERRKRAQDPN